MKAAHVLLLGIMFGTPAFADLETGDRVRVTAPSLFPSPLTGQVVPPGGEILTVLDDARESHEIPVSAVTVLEIGETRRHTGRGATWGAGIGAVAGLVVGLVYASDSGGSSSITSNVGPPAPVVALAPAAVGALLGVIVGAPIGALFTETEWHPVALPTQDPVVSPLPGP